MAYKALVIVNGTALPDSSTYQANTAVLVDSARNVQGKMIGSVIRENVAKVDMTYNFLTMAQWAAINALFDTTRGGAFINNVEFLNQDTGTYVTREMYVSDREAGAYLRDPNTKEIRGWTGCRLALIEV